MINEVFRVPNKIVIASPLVLFAGAAISGFEIASSASPPRKDKTKGVLLGALNRISGIKPGGCSDIHHRD